jgi:hypothetical protein
MSAVIPCRPLQELTSYECVDNEYRNKIPHVLNTPGMCGRRMS